MNYCKTHGTYLHDTCPECDYESVPKIHMLRAGGVSLCGQRSYEEGMGPADDPADVTCLSCKRLLLRRDDAPNR
jgi:hypothetical protein